MIDTRTAPYAALILRVTLGILFLAHAGLKVFVFTPAGAAQFFGILGLPPALAYLTILVETVGGLALIAGFYTRWAALALIPVLLGAIVTVHGPAGFFFNNPNGGWEYLALWIVGPRGAGAARRWRLCAAAPDRTNCSASFTPARPKGDSTWLQPPASTGSAAHPAQRAHRSRRQRSAMST